MGEQLDLLSNKAIYWTRFKTLFIADLHLGKVIHFRKAGLAVPERAGHNNFTVLQDLLLNQAPDKVFILGDLFHSVINDDWNKFTEFLAHFNQTEFHLVKGNHDILDERLYENSALTIHDDILNLPPFSLSHYPTEGTQYYNLAGHIHPCIKLRGPSRQTLRLPCFYFGTKGGILPAFGSFTGMHAIKPLKDDQIYAIAEGDILKIEQ